MSHKRILVIGAGFLGRALALRLAAAGCPVSLLSPNVDPQQLPSHLRGEGPGERRETSHAPITALHGRQEDPAPLSGLLAEHDTVIHAAWGTTPGASAGRPTLEAEKGLNPFLAFLQTLQRFPDARLLFLSSGGTVYGDPEHLPVTEEALLQPRSCHGAGKAAAELFLRLRRPDRTIILRPSNVYGPGQSLRGGFGVIRHLLHCAAEETPFQLWGDGAQVRDYLYIDDFTEAVCRLALHPTAAGVFNLGSGSGTSLRELIALVENVTGRKICVERQAGRGGDVARIVLGASRIRRAIEWAPTIGLEEGIARTWTELQTS